MARVFLFSNNLAYSDWVKLSIFHTKNSKLTVNKNQGSIMSWPHSGQKTGLRSQPAWVQQDHKLMPARQLGLESQLCHFLIIWLELFIGLTYASFSFSVKCEAYLLSSEISYVVKIKQVSQSKDFMNTCLTHIKCLINVKQLLLYWLFRWATFNTIKLWPKPQMAS